ncbi:MAG: hypothetical protein EP329_13010 [Deltaproteobacteria bacterium]|nr:MAG: hypothetical protein EP329_13010 [Deltaproteobacteria bacterium]
MRVCSTSEPCFQRVPAPPGEAFAYPERYRDQLLIDTLHDGDAVPSRLLANPLVKAAWDDGTLQDAFEEHRDWGADLVAGHLAAALGLAGHHKVATARVVMDFNRFPGESPPDADPLERRALGEPLAELLTHDDKRHVLEDHYDAVSRGMDRAITGRLLKLAIHTYDEHNDSRTRRPEVSLLTRSDSYQRDSRLPYGLFDPLFPHVLVESCAKPIVRDRIALTLERAGFAVEHNYPYNLPDGSVEIRCQPWLFFQHLRGQYEVEYPARAADPGHTRMWEMLLNTNLRGTGGDALSAYLHRFQLPPGDVAPLERAREAYEELSAWIGARPELIERYRRSPDRTSTITIEVRKDLVWRFDGGRPVGPREDVAKEVARTIAQAVATYLSEDREIQLDRR